VKQKIDLQKIEIFQQNEETNSMVASEDLRPEISIEFKTISNVVENIRAVYNTDLL